ncbi:MAG: hypothetical protein HKN18_10295 [Silicimonas sp.]|nr:hypothetical protein [Silicimonas sp.]
MVDSVFNLLTTLGSPPVVDAFSSSTIASLGFQGHQIAAEDLGVTQDVGETCVADNMDILNGWID